MPPVRELRPDVPAGLDKLLSQMMAKNPWERPQTPAHVVEALKPFTKVPIDPPPTKEMPQLSPALRVGRGPGVPQGGASSRRSWVFGSQVSSNALQATPPPSQTPTKADPRAGTSSNGVNAESNAPRL